MKTATLFVMLLVGGGLAAIVTGLLVRVRDRERSLAEILDLPYGERDVPVEAITETHSPIVAGTVGLAGRVVDHFDAKGSLAASLERGRIPLRPGEYVVVSGGVGVIVAALLVAVTTAWTFAVVGFGLTVLMSAVVPRYRANKRRKAFQAQLPDAMTLIASSLSAGHTFLRSIQMMCEESPPPLSEEFSRVVAETRLGGSVVDALDHMAERLQVRDLKWVVQAIRIQQTVGGKLGELLHTLADFMRARDEVRREVQVLSAEGRMSAYVLTGLPVFLLLAVQVLNPGYLAPMLQGWGLAVLGATGAFMALGSVVIFRMVKIEV